MYDYSLVNVVTFAVGLGFLYNGYRLVKGGREAVAMFVTSAIVGCGLLVVAVIPNVFALVADLLGLEMKARAILIVSNLTLFVLFTYLLNKFNQMYNNVSRMNEELSLLRAEIRERDD